MIASLPMYWREETAQAWLGFWDDVRAALNTAIELTPPDDLPADWTAHWLDKTLLLSQTCSYPLRTALRGKVTYVGTFDFGLDAPAGHYFSQCVTAGANMQPQRLAINSRDSQSGFIAGFDRLEGGAPHTAYGRHCDDVLITGGHRAALMAVAEGRADVAYIDAVTYRLCKTYDDWAGVPHLAGKTRPTPGLPLITAKGRDPAPLRAALRAACQLPKWVGHPALGGLRGFVVLDEAAYFDLPIPVMPDGVR